MNRRAKKVIDNAADVTAQSERYIKAALALLEHERPLNAYGFYMDRHMVEAEMMAAWRDIRRALDVMYCPWPTPRDLDGV